MVHITELILGTLAVVLGGAAFAVGWQVLRDAWRGAFGRPSAKRAEPAMASDRPQVHSASTGSDALHTIGAKSGRP
jgi:hypothetical protein